MKHLTNEEQLIDEWAKQLGQRVLNTPTQGYDSETVLYSDINVNVATLLRALSDARGKLAAVEAEAKRQADKKYRDSYGEGMTFVSKRILAILKGGSDG